MCQLNDYSIVRYLISIIIIDALFFLNFSDMVNRLICSIRFLYNNNIAATIFHKKKSILIYGFKFVERAAY